MQMHKHNNAMPEQLECEAVLSDLVLQAARKALPKDAGRWFADTRALRHIGSRNEPLLPLLIGLLDATRTVAAAINDNAWDDCRAIDKGLATELASQAKVIAANLMNASDVC